MFIRKSISALGFAIAFGAPVAALADSFWETTNDETGTRIVAPPFGTNSRGAASTAVKPLRLGDISTDRQYVFVGEEGGWQLRPMQYRVEGGRLAHVDDPVGHMERLADTRPLTEQQRATLESSGG